MGFRVELQHSLNEHESRLQMELAGGATLEEVLSRQLLAVEKSAQTLLLTSILLLDSNRKRLWHAAAPSLPRDYCEMINGSEIGPTAGSCGTAAFLDRPIYVTDIASDPLWSDYRHIALPHGLRACWSTPIRDSRDVLIGTFAVYHLSPRSPTREEVTAINMITQHVARTVEWSRAAGVSSDERELGTDDPGDCSEGAHEANHAQQLLSSIQSDFEKLVLAIDRAMERSRACCGEEYLDVLQRAKEAAMRGAAAAGGKGLPH